MAASVTFSLQLFRLPSHLGWYPAGSAADCVYESLTVIVLLKEGKSKKIAQEQK